MPGDEARSAPRLPEGAPAELQRFLDCELDAVDIDVSEVDWLPKSGADLVEVALEPGAAANHATMRIGLGMLSVSIGVSIVDGELVLDTSSIPDIEGVTDGLKDAVERWCKRINEGFAGHGKQLGALRVRGKVASLTKVPVGATPPPTAAASPVPAPAADEPAETSNWKKLVGYGVGAVLGAGALIGGCLALTGDGDEEAEPPEATDDAPPAEEPAADEPAAEQATDDDQAGVDDGDADDEPEVAQAVPTPGGALTIGVGPELFETVNPFLPRGEGARDTLDPIFAGVSDIDPLTGELVPEVVAELPTVANGGISLNEDGSMTVRYLIRDDAVWADGTPITGDDFAFTYDIILNPDLPIDRSIYEDITATDAGVDFFALTLPEPTIEHERLFDTLIPRHQVEGSDFVNDWNDRMWVSGGPFVFDEWQRGEFLRLVRNDNYWRTDEDTGIQLPYLDSVVFRFIPETASLVDAFRDREIDVIDPPLSIETIEALQALEPQGASVEVLSGPIWEHLNFQFGDNRLAANPDSLNEHLAYRQAVAHAIDKNTIIDEILRGQVEPLDSYVDAFSPTLSTSAWDQYDYDPAAAEQLLDELCGELGRDCDADPPTAVITARDPRVASLIIGDLAIVGIDARTPGSADGLLDGSGPVEIELREVDDPFGHLEFIGTMPNGAEIRLFSGGGVEVTAPSPFIPVVGQITPDGLFTATGSGSAAGFSGVDATASGSYLDGVLDLEYTLGGPLPNGPITYFFDGRAATEGGPASVGISLDEAQGFLDGLAVWVKFGGDRYGEFTYGALDPVVLHSYGPETCRDFFGQLPADPTFAVEVDGVGQPGPFLFEDPGPGIVVPSAVPIDVTLTSAGSTAQQRLHLRRDADGNVRWFSVCPSEPNRTLDSVRRGQFAVNLAEKYDLVNQRPFGESLDFGEWDLGEWAWVGSPGLSGLVGIHDVFDPEAPPPDGSNFYRWGTPEVSGSDPSGFDQGPSSVSDAATARYASVVDTARQTVDEAELEALIAEAEQILADQAVIIPLYRRPTAGASWGDEVGGVRFGATATREQWAIEEWYRLDL